MQPTPVHTARQLGAVVRTARQSAGLSQDALATRAGLERQWVVLLENGRLDNPTFANVLKALDALDLTVEVTDRVIDQPIELDGRLDDLLGM